MKADVPSRLSSVPAQSANRALSMIRPSAWLVSDPLCTASSAYRTASGALALIWFRIASARGISSALLTTSLTSPIRYAVCASIMPPERISWSAMPFPTSR